MDYFKIKQIVERAMIGQLYYLDEKINFLKEDREKTELFNMIVSRDRKKVNLFLSNFLFVDNIDLKRIDYILGIISFINQIDVLIDNVGIRYAMPLKLFELKEMDFDPNNRELADLGFYTVPEQENRIYESIPFLTFDGTGVKGKRNILREIEYFPIETDYKDFII